MALRVAIVYNEPMPDRYDTMGEAEAILGVLGEVEAVEKALHELGHLVSRVPLVPPLEAARARLQSLQTDLVFNLFEGFEGCPETEAIVAQMLSELKLPQTGNSGRTLALSSDKAKTKALMKASGIDTPEFQILTPETITGFHLGYPCIVKPFNENASHGLSANSVANNFSELERQVKLVSKLFGGKALVEKFLTGREFNATVMGTKKLTVLPVSEIVYSLPADMPPILTFEAKWTPESIYYQKTEPICPAEIDEGMKRRIFKMARAAFRLLGCQGYARVDMRLDAQGRLNVLEINPNPDISPTAGTTHQAKEAGISYNQFIEKVLCMALEDIKP